MQQRYSYILGGLLYGFLCDKYGRVWPYVVVMLNIAIFGLASAFSPNFVTFVCLRLFVAFGTTSSMIFLYSSLTEVLPVRNRGKILVSIMLVQSLGICASGGLAWWLIPLSMDGGFSSLQLLFHHFLLLAIVSYTTVATVSKGNV